MGTADVVIIALIVVVAVAVVLKMTVFKGPRWKREWEKENQGDKGSGLMSPTGGDIKPDPLSPDGKER